MSNVNKRELKCSKRCSKHLECGRYLDTVDKHKYNWVLDSDCGEKFKLFIGKGARYTEPSSNVDSGISHNKQRNGERPVVEGIRVPSMGHQ